MNHFFSAAQASNKFRDMKIALEADPPKTLILMTANFPLTLITCLICHSLCIGHSLYALEMSNFQVMKQALGLR